MQRLILDTGPLVAFLDRREAMHGWAVECFRQAQVPFLTCEAVLTEACFLLRRHPQAVDQIGLWLEQGFIRVAFRLDDVAPRVFALMEKYRDLPMSLADACLVVMVEQGIGERIFTLDRHFRMYRQLNRRTIPVLMPDQA
jgi:predicted nucleic acid-binding protein